MADCSGQGAKVKKKGGKEVLGRGGAGAAGRCDGMGLLSPLLPGVT